MAVEINTFPEVPETIQSTTLVEDVFRVRFTYRERPPAWWLDLLDRADVPRASGRRISPRSTPLWTFLDDVANDGVLLVGGEDPYPREDLGDPVKVTVALRAELEALRVADPRDYIGGDLGE